MRASARTLRPLAAGLAAYGVVVEHAFKDVGVDPIVLGQTDARVPASAVHALWRQSAELTGDDSFGINLARRIEPGSFDVLDYLCRNAPNVGAGLRNYCRYTQLLHDGIVASVSPHGEGFRLRHVLSDGTVVPRQYGEFIIAAIMTIARQATGQEIQPTEVHFLHPQPEDLSTHREFFRCPIRFEFESNGFDLASSVHALALEGAEPKLFHVLQQHANHLLSETPRPSNLVAQVRAAILEELHSGTVSAGGVAKRIGTSERTLRRRLDSEGTSYQRLLSELRTELAARYMQEEQLSIDEIALLLGFSDRSSFNRAFRQWTGKNPTEFRAAQRTA